MFLARPRIVVAAAVLLPVLALTGCRGTEHVAPKGAGGVGEPGHGCAGNPAATVPDGAGDTLVLEPATVAPGEHFTATFPGPRRVREDYLVLTSGGEPACRREFFVTGRLTREAPKNGTFAWLSSPRRRSSIPGTVPSSADPGGYVVCNDLTTVCGLLTVTD
ncbi:MAG: hypothetical protein U0R80_01385 [Nocardioidaceae bacterium]